MKRRVTTGKTAAAAKAANSDSALSIEQWSSQIRSVWAKGATNTLELARVVCEARQRLRYGAWAKMCQSKRLPFSKSKADMLISIGKHLGDLDAQTFGHLPSGWSILYFLSRLRAATVKRLVAEGVIHPGMKLDEARELLAKYRGKQRMRTKVNVGQRLRKFRDFVASTVREWMPAERALACTELAQLARMIAARDGGNSFDHLSDRADNRPWERTERPPRIVAFATPEPNWRHGGAASQ